MNEKPFSRRVDPQRHYDLAQQTFDLSAEADDAAARELARLLADRDGPTTSPAELRSKFDGGTVVVLGPVPGGAESLDPARPIVAAGSAVRQALSAGIQPTLIVTDLDGSDMGHETFSRIGVPMVVHGHGDNVHRLRRMLPRLEGPLMGTCQTPPPEDAPIELHRFGGFTDGDRACFLLQALGAARLELVGWDLEEPVTGGQSKQAKLELASTLLEDLEIPWDIVETGAPSVERFSDLDIGEGVDLREL